jgi:hypothetical protein
MNIRHASHAVIPMFLVGFLFLVPLPAVAQSPLVGNWYGETVLSGKIEGQDYNFRRWLRVNHADGIQRIVFRYYMDGVMRGEEVWQGRWTYQNGVYSSACESVLVNGKIKNCSSRVDYDVHSIDAKEMQYTSRSSGKRYRTSRVADDFRLP